MDAFGLQRHVVADYADYTKSFVRIADERLRRRVGEEMAAGLLSAEPLKATSSPPRRTSPTTFPLS
jgi:hypothetical protein